MASRDYKVVIVGDVKVGKSTFVKRFLNEYTTTLDSDVHPLKFVVSAPMYPDLKTVVLNFWSDSVQDARDGANGVLAFYDEAESCSYTEMVKGLTDVEHVSPDVHVVTCAVVARDASCSVGCADVRLCAMSGHAHGIHIEMLIRKLLGDDKAIVI